MAIVRGPRDPYRSAAPRIADLGLLSSRRRVLSKDRGLKWRRYASVGVGHYWIVNLMRSGSRFTASPRAEVRPQDSRRWRFTDPTMRFPSSSKARSEAGSRFETCSLDSLSRTQDDSMTTAATTIDRSTRGRGRPVRRAPGHRLEGILDAPDAARRTSDPEDGLSRWELLLLSPSFPHEWLKERLGISSWRSSSAWTSLASPPARRHSDADARRGASRAIRPTTWPTWIGSGARRGSTSDRPSPRSGDRGRRNS